MYDESINLDDEEDINNEPEYDISSIRSALREEAMGAAFGGGFGGGFIDSCDIDSMSDEEVLTRAMQEGLL